jgi:hypothetical protein
VNRITTAQYLKGQHHINAKTHSEDMYTSPADTSVKKHASGVYKASFALLSYIVLFRTDRYYSFPVLVTTATATCNPIDNYKHQTISQIPPTMQVRLNTITLSTLSPSPSNHSTPLPTPNLRGGWDSNAGDYGSDDDDDYDNAEDDDDDVESPTHEENEADTDRFQDLNDYEWFDMGDEGDDGGLSERRTCISIYAEWRL